jgi:putative PIN family toxin of toxin-antitoxin system
MKELKVVIDTNVLVSILKGSSRLSPIYTAFKEGRFKLIISTEIIKELAAVLYRPRLQIEPEDIRELLKLLKKRAIRLKSQIRLPNVCRDPKDNFILELAIEAKADIIVTGDEDLLVLNSFRSIPIIRPKQFLSQLRK